jgi:aryl-alcohol dehydrogenase-like predicted oxidoreductase
MSGSHNGLLSEVAEKRGAPRAQIALAWVLQKDPITSSYHWVYESISP